MRLAKLLTLAALAAGLCAFAQTWTPKQIRLQGADASEQPELLRVLALKPGSPVNKAEIEAALQRLADTGSFADISYTVDGNALTIMLKPAADSQALPVRFSNFVWWQPGELEPLVEARVPLFHGKLPLTGQLTNQVSTALVALLAEKGIADAKVTVGTSILGTGGSSNAGGSGLTAVVLSVAQPAVTVGNIELLGTAAPVRQQASVVTSRLAGQDFDMVETAAAIQNNITDTHRNFGYLDARVDSPVFSAPRKEMFGFAVDANADVHPGTQYHIGALDLNPPPPVSHDEAERVTELHVGDPAGAMALKVAEGQLERAYEAHGHLEAHVLAVATLDAANHLVVDRFSIDPGALDHFAGVNASALSPELQAAFTREWHGPVGGPADSKVFLSVFDALRTIGATRTVTLQRSLDRAQHTVTITLLPKASGSISQP